MKIGETPIGFQNTFNTTEHICVPYSVSNSLLSKSITKTADYNLFFLHLHGGNSITKCRDRPMSSSCFSKNKLKTDCSMFCLPVATIMNKHTNTQICKALSLGNDTFLARLIIV